MIRAEFASYSLQFKRPGGTSRGILTSKDTWFIRLTQTQTGNWGIGETGLFKGLSFDDRPDYAQKIEELCKQINTGEPVESCLGSLNEWPSLRFGLETAWTSLQSKSPWELYPSQFTSSTDGIPINGLIWMGEPNFIQEQIAEKLKAGFRCLKLKIGALPFDQECDILRSIRQTFDSGQLEIRVDANGAFSPSEALEKLKRLNSFELHSIEQPMRRGQWKEMKRLVQQSPLAIALDEELIGIVDQDKQQEMLDVTLPEYIILKPALVGGFEASSRWIELAEERNIGWWITSALESNVGLNAIAQYTYTLGSSLHQGLGTGQLFTNNFDSPLQIQAAALHYGPGNWNIEQIQWHDPS